MKAGLSDLHGGHGFPEASAPSSLSTEEPGSESQPASPGHLALPAVFSESCSLKV